MSPIDLEHGEDDAEEKPRRGPGRPKKDETISGLQTSINEQLQELSEWVKVRDPELAELMLADVPKMAKFLAARAGKHARLAKLLKVVFAADGPLAGLRAFGRTTRAIGGRIGAWRESRAIDADYEEVDEHGQPVYPQP